MVRRTQRLVPGTHPQPGPLRPLMADIRQRRTLAEGSGGCLGNTNEPSMGPKSKPEFSPHMRDDQFVAGAGTKRLGSTPPRGLTVCGPDSGPGHRSDYLGLFYGSNIKGSPKITFKRL
jgi:hypothetical protein